MPVCPGRRRPPRLAAATRAGTVGLLLVGALMGAPAPARAAVPPPRPDAARPVPVAEPLVLDPAVAPAERDGWVVTAARGPLRWRPLGLHGWRPAWAGRVVPYASEIEAAHGARATLAAGGVNLTLHEDGRLVLLRPEAGGAPRRVQQDRGRVRFRVDPEATRPAAPAFEVVTPMLVVTVKGTLFDVDVTDSASEVRVVRGLVAVIPSAGGGSARAVDVAAGQGVRLGAAAALAVPELFRLDGDDAPIAGLPPWLAALAVGLSALIAAGLAVFLGRDGVLLAVELRRRWLTRPGGKAKRRRKLLHGG